MKKVLLIILMTVTLNSFSQNISKQVQNNNTFALNIIKYLKNDSSNFFVSPISISSALAMTYEGAENKTKEQMQKILMFNDDKNKLRADITTIINQAKATRNTDYYNLKVYNTIWAQKDYNFLYNFVNNLEKGYKAPVNFVDFSSEESRKLIIAKLNSTVSKQTENKINNLLTDDDIDEETKMILVNAIYFSAKWKIAFDKKKSTEKTFIGYNHKQKTMFMNKTIQAKYFENDKYKYIEIPYKDNKAKICIVLPNDKKGLADIKSTFNYASLVGLEKNAEFKTVKISLPKFNIDNKIELSKILYNAGMELPFTDQADFTAMTCKKELKIDKVIHQAFINIDEAGTEASAATAVVMKRITSTGPSKKVEFNADHPFLFFIKENKTKSILFLGQLLEIEK